MLMRSISTCVLSRGSGSRGRLQRQGLYDLSGSDPFVALSLALLYCCIPESQQYLLLFFAVIGAWIRIERYHKHVMAGHRPWQSGHSSGYDE
ncbi:hypothetical protein IAQ61_009597 [Plenodomus lingam]|uniref:Predicted protein n=1 Tax=Leptosphaeria maculans (strain JN3 / isolate v23.1.3 / race Av1-4-5-6-7-8) TaxID=985895 RepID=E4ZSX6_LEPMJ|nr:predicted protein [Plenodomus lingam JN3]KAH9863320.1 hypothetical protein IAQ61_009597 [Plenodomus lingam]CBX94564.1 predicted protein [Plenodomus lingam JN3]